MGTATSFIHQTLALRELLSRGPAKSLRNFDGFWSMDLRQAVECLIDGTTETSLINFVHQAAGFVGLFGHRLAGLIPG